jgi:hypothetical protein
VPIEELKAEIRRRVLDGAVEKKSTRSSAFVFVDMDSADQPMARQVCDILERHGVGYALPLEVTDPSEVRRDLEQNLEECDALIIVYGVTTAAWVRGQLRECQKAVARRERPLLSLGVFEGPPEQKADLGMNFPNMNMRIVNCRGGLSDVDVARFLQSIR